MNIELISTGKEDYEIGEIYHLFINGKTDGYKYDRDGMGADHPWSMTKKHMESLMQIKCKDYPEELRLWNLTAYPISLGTLSLFEIEKKGNKMLFEIGFDFGTKSFNKENWPLNPFLLAKKIYTLSRGSVFKKGEDADFDLLPTCSFNFKSDLTGTISDKFKIAFETLTRIVNKAEEDLRSEAKNYLK